MPPAAVVLQPPLLVAADHQSSSTSRWRKAGPSRDPSPVPGPRSCVLLWWGLSRLGGVSRHQWRLVPVCSQGRRQWCRRSSFEESKVGFDDVNDTDSTNTLSIFFSRFNFCFDLIHSVWEEPILTNGGTAGFCWMLYIKVLKRAPKPNSIIGSDWFDRTNQSSQQLYQSPVPIEHKVIILK